MMQVMTKWCVRVEFAGKEDDIYFWFSDNHYQNVMREVAKMDFAGRVQALTVTKEDAPQQHGVALHDPTEGR